MGGDDAQLPVGARDHARAELRRQHARSRCRCRARYDLELAAAKYFYSLPDGDGAAQLPLHRLGPAPRRRRADPGRAGPVVVLGAVALPVATWRRMMERLLPERRLGRGCTPTRSRGCGAAARARLAVARRCSRELLDASAGERRDGRPASSSCSAPCSTRATRSTRTRRARPRTRRRRRSGSSTRPPTPARRRRRYDRLRLHGVALAAPAARVAAEVRFLQAAPEGGHSAAERRLAARPRRSASSSRAARSRSTSDGVSGRVRALSAEPLGGGLWRVALCVHNTTALAGGAGAGRGAAREPALHAPAAAASRRPVRLAARARRRDRRGRRRCESVNTFPVLATAADDVLLGAAIVLPDHPAAGAREPRRPVRRHRDRGGAAAPRARAQRRRARRDRPAGSRGAGDDRARRRRDAGRYGRACTGAGADRSRDRGEAAMSDRARCATRSPARSRSSSTASPSGAATRSTLRLTRARRPLRPDARRPGRDDRADLLRLRGQALLRRHGRRRPRPGPDARHRPVPVLLRRRGGGDASHDAS